LGIAAGVGFAALLASLGNASIAGAESAPVLDLADAGNAAALPAGVAATNQLFGIFNDNITDGVAVADAGINQTYEDYLGALPSVSDPAAFFGMVEVSAQLLEQQGSAALSELGGLADVLMAEPDTSNAPVVDLSDGLAAVTNLFDGFSSNTADIVNSTGTAVDQTYADFVGALPSVSTVSAFIGMVESSAEILSSQGQAYVTDVAGTIAALATELGQINVSAANIDPSDIQSAITNQFDTLSANLTENWTITQDAFGALGSNPLGAFESGFELLESLLQGDLTDIIGFTGALGADLGLTLESAI
jgi:hypothetical protein